MSSSRLVKHKRLEQGRTHHGEVTRRTPAKLPMRETPPSTGFEAKGINELPLSAVRTATHITLQLLSPQKASVPRRASIMIIIFVTDFLRSLSQMLTHWS